jgi:hypothetical protein
MANNGWYEVAASTVEIPRPGSKPENFDVEYEVEYRVLRRGYGVSGIEYLGELVTTQVTYYPSLGVDGVKVEWADLSEDAKKRIDAATEKEFEAISRQDDRDDWKDERGFYAGG